MLATVAHRVVPKRDRAVLYGWPDNEDSVLALEEALQATSLEVVVLASQPGVRPPRPHGPRTRVVPKSSLRGWWAFLRARYVFFTHRCYLRAFSDRAVSVNVWHGMPIKRIGRDLPGDSAIGSTHVLATSPLWADVMRRAMCPEGQVLCTGLPRNDRLVVDRARVRSTLGLDPTAGGPLVVWLPTYRRSVRGHRTVDGAGIDSPFGMDDVDPQRLDDLLGSRSATALVKPHPLAAQVGAQRWQHLRLVDDAWLQNRGLSLYEVLGAADVLVSDVSSVVVDFLLLDRPVVHAMADLDEYRDNRGFTLEPVEDHLIGPVVLTGAELLQELAAVLDGEDRWVERRRTVRDLFHTHQDHGAARRLLAELGLVDR